MRLTKSLIETKTELPVKNKIFLKRKLICLILISSSQILSPQSSQAIFGLSKCEKFWKQVKIQESKVTYFQSLYSQGEVWISSQEFPKVDRVYSSLSEIWKIGTNNPKCLSNTQKIAIKEMRSQAFKDSVLSWGGGVRSSGSSVTYRYRIGKYIPLTSR